MSISISTEVTSPGMVQIRKWEDATLFAGSFVAYKANNYYFNKGSEGYAFLESDSTRYGYIPEKSTTWSNNQKGYEIYRLVKPNVQHTTCGLTTPKLKSFPTFSMRLATSEEVSLIGKKITTKEAEFESVPNLEMERILHQTIREIMRHRILGPKL